MTKNGFQDQVSWELATAADVISYETWLNTHPDNPRKEADSAWAMNWAEQIAPAAIRRLLETLNAERKEHAEQQTDVIKALQGIERDTQAARDMQQEAVRANIQAQEHKRVLAEENRRLRHTLAAVQQIYIEGLTHTVMSDLNALTALQAARLIMSEIVSGLTTGRFSSDGSPEATATIVHLGEAGALIARADAIERARLLKGDPDESIRTAGDRGGDSGEVEVD